MNRKVIQLRDWRWSVGISIVTAGLPIGDCKSMGSGLGSVEASAYELATSLKIR